MKAHSLSILPACCLQLMLAADEGHSVSQRHNKLEFISRSMRFLEQHLNLPGVPRGCRTKR